MKPLNGTISSKAIIFTFILILAAAILLAAAFMEPKQPETGDWVPLNDAVKSAVAAIEAADTGEEDVKNKKDTEMIPEKEQEASAAGVDHRNEQDGKAALKEDTIVSTAPAAPIADAGMDDAAKLDINRATEAELDDLKGIGPSKAKAIIEDRERNGKFATVNDLLRVKGIGEKLLKGLEDSIVARP
ncbi:ComEA family DNA-binding protein [Paenibacillus sp. MCAF9]|uniref:ComEA family DNA-binding protein n=1 Tax=Paenibacillus sp. MCAF9 TaxID=3233046 RepID=UPI003F9CAE60